MFRSGQSLEELGTLGHRHIQKLLLLGKWDVILNLSIYYQIYFIEFLQFLIIML